MIFKWENEKERLAKFMKITPQKKLEWLLQMNEFLHKFSPKKQQRIRQKLRGAPYLEDYADAQIAKDRFNDPKSRIISGEELKKRLGV